MNSKIFYYFLVVVLMAVAVAGSIGFYYAAFGTLPRPLIFLKKDQAAPSVISDFTESIQVLLHTDNHGKLLFAWKNLPETTKEIRIFRAREGQPRWTLWKTISIGDFERGDLQIQGGNTASLLGYTYYFEAITEDGEVVWTSDPQEIEENIDNPFPASSPDGSPVVPPQNTNSTSTSSSPSSPQTEPSSGSASSSASTSTTASGTTPPPQPTDTSTIIYYTPSGEISGYGSSTLPSFSVRHVNQKIEINWQNLPNNTNRIVISRSTSQSGSWTELLSQTSPVLTSYSIFLVDDAVKNAFYYKLDVYENSSFVETRGPVFLGALE